MIPTVWAIVGSLAVTFGLYQDLGLPVFAAGYWVIQWHERGSPFAHYFEPAGGRAGMSAPSMFHQTEDVSTISAVTIPTFVPDT